MTENSTSAVGRSAIDAYLDSVEQALLAAHAPRSDRLQVLQDLESQIAEMLASEATSLTDEIVQAIIAKLEPAGHFAATYGNGADKEPLTARSFRLSPLPSIRWPYVAALGCAFFIVSCLPTLSLASTHARGEYLLFVLVGLILTPFLLWMAVRQLRAQPGQLSGRDLVLKSAVAYGVVAPALFMILATTVTRGFILFPLGIAAFVYLQYLFVKRLHRYFAETLPPQPVSASSDASPHGPTPPLESALSMPTM